MPTVFDKQLQIGSAVLTETGVLLGWLKRRGFADNDTADGASLILSGVPFLWMPEVVSGAYKLSIEEVVSSENNRVVLFEGAEKRLEILAIGVLDRLGISITPSQKAYTSGRYLQDDEDPCRTMRTIAGWNDEDDSWGYNDDEGFSPAFVPRRPSPEPSDGEAEIPLE